MWIIRGLAELCGWVVVLIVLASLVACLFYLAKDRLAYGSMANRVRYASKAEAEGLRRLGQNLRNDQYWFTAESEDVAVFIRLLSQPLLSGSGYNTAALRDEWRKQTGRTPTTPTPEEEEKDV